MSRPVIRVHLLHELGASFVPALPELVARELRPRSTQRRSRRRRRLVDIVTAAACSLMCRPEPWLGSAEAVSAHSGPRAARPRGAQHAVHLAPSRPPRQAPRRSPVAAASISAAAARAQGGAREVSNARRIERVGVVRDFDAVRVAVPVGVGRERIRGARVHLGCRRAVVVAVGVGPFRVSSGGKFETVGSLSSARRWDAKSSRPTSFVVAAKAGHPFSAMSSRSGSEPAPPMSATMGVTALPSLAHSLAVHAVVAAGRSAESAQDETEWDAVPGAGIDVPRAPCRPRCRRSATARRCRGLAGAEVRGAVQVLEVAGSDGRVPARCPTSTVPAAVPSLFQGSNPLVALSWP